MNRIFRLKPALILISISFLALGCSQNRPTPVIPKEIRTPDPEKAADSLRAGFKKTFLPGAACCTGSPSRSAALTGIKK